MTTRTASLAFAAFALGVVACSATIDGSPLVKDSPKSSDDTSTDDEGTDTTPNAGTTPGSGTGTGTGAGNGTGGGKDAGSDASSTDAATTDSGEGGTATLKAFGEVCVADGDCTSKACFKGGMGAYCSFLCTVATAATDCPVPPTAGMCNNQGYCRK